MADFYAARAGTNAGAPLDGFLTAVHTLRRAKDVADEAKDNATSGLIDTWTDEAERRAWFLFEVSR